MAEEALANSNDWRIRFENLCRLRELGPKVVAQEAEALEGIAKRWSKDSQATSPLMSDSVPITEYEVQAIQSGFRSPEGKEIRRSLQSLAILLSKVGFKEDSRKVTELYRLSSEAADREAVIASIQKAETFLQSKLDDLRRLAASLKPLAASSHGQMAGSQRAPHIVLNCANIGCAFGGNQEQHGKNSGKFDWSGVEHAFNFYNQKGYIIHAIIGQRLLHKAGRDRISAKLKEALVVIPSRDDMRDNDDFSTILEAYKYKCPFVDNDNYRDWGMRIKDPEVAKWYGQNKTHLHVAYYFDRFGNFTPLKGAIPKPEMTMASPSAPAVGEKRLPMQVEVGVQNIELGPEIYDNDSDGTKWKVLRPTTVWPRFFDQVSPSLRPLKTLKAGLTIGTPKRGWDVEVGFFCPGEVCKVILQRPERGEALWLAIHPRGWIKVRAPDGTANVDLSQFGNLLPHAPPPCPPLPKSTYLHASMTQQAESQGLCTPALSSQFHCFARSRYPWMRKLALEAMAVMEPQDLAMHSDVVAERLRDTDDDVCYEAIRTMKKLQPETLEKHAAILSRLLADEDWNVRLAALGTLSRLELSKLCHYEKEIKHRCDDEVWQVKELAEKVWTRLNDLPRRVYTCRISDIDCSKMAITCTSMAGNVVTSLSIGLAGTCDELREMVAETLGVPPLQLKLLNSGTEELIGNIPLTDVRLISGQLLAKVSCFRSEGLRKLRQRVKEACQIAGPFWLLQNQQMLRSPCLGQPDPLKTIEANAPLVLVKRSISDLSQELVGLEGAAFRGDAQEAFAPND
eukprot:symbB.v1.2.029741.t2/scaffold3290.1/size59655/4